MSEMVILVDEKDQQLGIEEKMRAHELGLLHRAFSVFIFREHAGQLRTLLQQRQEAKYHCGGLWTNTCCSHPRVGETIIQAAQRRLQEEMGLDVALSALDMVGAFCYRAEFANGLIEHEYDHVLSANIDIVKKTDKDKNINHINFNTTEVQACKWVNWQDLLHDLMVAPQKYTPWLQGAVNVITN
jgi:isopentenyl-diphosphate delta-isomerase